MNPRSFNGASLLGLLCLAASVVAAAFAPQGHDAPRLDILRAHPWSSCAEAPPGVVIDAHRPLTADEATVPVPPRALAWPRGAPEGMYLDVHAGVTDEEAALLARLRGQVVARAGPQ